MELKDVLELLKLKFKCMEKRIGIWIGITRIGIGITEIRIGINGIGIKIVQFK